jgi:hypothetical protein
MPRPTGGWAHFNAACALRGIPGATIGKCVGEIRWKRCHDRIQRFLYA